VDDVHLLTHPGCHDVLRAVAEGIPLGSQLLLLIRIDPPAWLCLMARAWTSPGDGERPDARLSASRSDRFVADYLRSEVPDGLSSRLREFLRRTSVLEELTAPACNAVLDVDDSAAVLHDISRCVPLVVPLGPDRLRYHQLLADVLRADLDDQEPWLVPVSRRP
jgi:LuxR family maltose regulon positive regulatory protein